MTQPDKEQPTTPPKSPTDSTSDAAARLHRPIMQSMPETRTQSFDEIYGPPENFLEIEVCVSPLLAPPPWAADRRSIGRGRRRRIMIIIRKRKKQGPG